jgi:hypothetical protein
MIMHRILILLRYLAYRADILTGAVFLIDIHGLVLGGLGAVTSIFSVAYHLLLGYHLL